MYILSDQRLVNKAIICYFTVGEILSCLDFHRGEQVMQVEKEPVKSRGFLLDVALNAVEPGFNKSVLLVLNIAFILLLLTLLAVTFLTGLNVHVIFLGVLALGLQIAFNW